jgi:hypothetical protein
VLQATRNVLSLVLLTCRFTNTRGWRKEKIYVCDTPQRSVQYVTVVLTGTLYCYHFAICRFPTGSWGATAQRITKTMCSLFHVVNFNKALLFSLLLFDSGLFMVLKGTAIFKSVYSLYNIS